MDDGRKARKWRGEDEKEGSRRRSGGERGRVMKEGEGRGTGRGGEAVVSVAQ